MQNKKLKLSEKDKKILKQIKQTILNTAKEMNIEIDKIILFGSRARGDYEEDSDWDILIVTKRKLSKEKIFDFLAHAEFKLYDYLNRSVDLLITSNNEYKKKIHLNGKIYFWVNQQGVII